MLTSGAQPLEPTPCDQEVIHIPGAIQPHGVLLAFETIDGPPVVWSENLVSRYGCAPEAIGELRLEDLVASRGDEMLDALETSVELRHLNPVHVRLQGRRWEGVVHRIDDLIVLELEPAAQATAFAPRAIQAHIQRAIGRLRTTRSLDDLLEMTVRTVSELTGYDRVLIYRFEKDEHGTVIAERVAPDLAPFLGLHYPATDIPRPARELYKRNPLRIIADSHYEPCPLVPERVPSTGRPLDLTLSTLRSISPIHQAYLRNMGVRSSMSLSLVVDDELWGLVICHHRETHFVPYSVRGSCEMLVQTLSWMIGSRQRELAARELGRVDRSIGKLLERAGRRTQLEDALVELPDELLGLTRAAGAAVIVGGSLRTVGEVPDEDSLRGLVSWWVCEAGSVPLGGTVDTEDDRFEGTLEPAYLITDCMSRFYPEAEALGAVATGVLGIGFPAAHGNVLLWFRPVTELTLRWGGDPHKVAAELKRGQRPQPRESFDEWRELVRDRAEPWLDHEIMAARRLHHSLSSLLHTHSLEAERTRMMFMSILSHDLRTPLGALMASARILQQVPTTDALTRKMSDRIRTSGNRMQRMIDQLLDVSHIMSSDDGALPIHRRRFDARALVHDLVRETELARPGVPMVVVAPQDCELDGDPDRVAQVIGNLLSNARHHGAPDSPVEVELRCESEAIVLEVRNQGEPITPSMMGRLFEPFKLNDASTQHRGPGLGLGLYITHAIVTAHGGSIAVESDTTRTSFKVSLPRPS